MMYYTLLNCSGNNKDIYLPTDDGQKLKYERMWNCTKLKDKFNGCYNDARIYAMNVHVCR